MVSCVEYNCFFIVNLINYVGDKVIYIGYWVVIGVDYLCFGIVVININIFWFLLCEVMWIMLGVVKMWIFGM